MSFSGAEGKGFLSTIVVSDLIVGFLPVVVNITDLEVVEGSDKVSNFDEEATVIAVNIRNLGLVGSSPSGGIAIVPRSAIVVHSPRVPHMHESGDNFASSVLDGIGSHDSVGVTAWKTKLCLTVCIDSNKILVSNSVIDDIPNSVGIVIKL